MGLRVVRWPLVLVVAFVASSASVRAEEDEAVEEPAAAPSITIAPARGSTQIPHPADRKWKLGERACTDDGRCGTVRMVTRDYAVVDVAVPKPKAPPKKKRRDPDPQEPEPPPKPAEPEPPSGFSGVPADTSDAPLLIPDSPAPVTVPTAPTGPTRRRPRTSMPRPEPRQKRREAHAWWAHVQVNVLGAFRSEAKQFAPQLSWNPTFSFEGNFRIRANLGLSALRTEATSTFLVIEPAMFASFGNGTFRFEPGAGAQIWTGDGVYPLLQLNLAIAFEGNEETPRFFERFFVAPGIVFSKFVPTYVVKAGLGIAF